MDCVFSRRIAIFGDVRRYRFHENYLREVLIYSDEKGIIAENLELNPDLNKVAFLF
jgi:hypothetical protein